MVWIRCRQCRAEVHLTTLVIAISKNDHPWFGSREQRLHRVLTLGSCLHPDVYTRLILFLSGDRRSSRGVSNAPYVIYPFSICRAELEFSGRSVDILRSSLKSPWTLMFRVSGERRQSLAVVRQSLRQYVRWRSTTIHGGRYERCC
jgi:hypothetical protein